MSLTTTHPECRDGEIFICNADKGTWPSIDWKTKRKGGRALWVKGDKAGQPLAGAWHGAFPVFVKKSEIHAEDPHILEGLIA